MVAGIVDGVVGGVEGMSVGEVVGGRWWVNAVCRMGGGRGAHHDRKE